MIHRQKRRFSAHKSALEVPCCKSGEVGGDVEKMEYREMNTGEPHHKSQICERKSNEEEKPRERMVFLPRGVHGGFVEAHSQHQPVGDRLQRAA